MNVGGISASLIIERSRYKAKYFAFKHFNPQTVLRAQSGAPTLVGAEQVTGRSHALADWPNSSLCDPNLKKEAAAVLAEMGLSVSDAIRLMLVRVAADRALPFDVRSPNKETEAALRAARKGDVAHFDSVAALMDDLDNEESPPL